MAKKQEEEGDNSTNKSWGELLDSVSERAEIDTSAPFESVKEAVSRFGELGFWKPNFPKPQSPASSQPHDVETTDIAKVEEQAVQLEKELVIKEKETFNILQELESTKMLVEKLKLKIEKEAFEANSTADPNLDNERVYCAVKNEEKESQEMLSNNHQLSVGGLDLCPSSTPGFILMELKQAKVNLTRTTSDLLGIRATVESYNKKLEKERNSLEKTRQRLSSSSSKISSLEEELNQTKQKLHLAKVAEVKASSGDTLYISREIHRLGSAKEHYKQIGEAAEVEVLRTTSEIEQTKSTIETAEIRLIAAKKIKEAARASEDVALAEVKALSKSEALTESDQHNNQEVISLSYEEYSALASKAHEAEDLCKMKESDALLLVEKANASESEILKRVEEATKELETSKEDLEEALNRVEAANRGKLAVEEALRKWRSEHGQKRRSSQNSTKFKISANRKDSRLLDVNGLNMTNDDLKPVLKQTLSIGQILSRKLLLTEEFENGVQSEVTMAKQKTSLGQMITKTIEDDKHLARKCEGESGHKQVAPKRKKFGFTRISLLTIKQSKKDKKKTAGSRVPMCT